MSVVRKGSRGRGGTRYSKLCRIFVLIAWSATFVLLYVVTISYIHDSSNSKEDRYRQDRGSATSLFVMHNENGLLKGSIIPDTTLRHANPNPASVTESPSKSSNVSFVSAGQTTIIAAPSSTPSKRSDDHQLLIAQQAYVISTVLKQLKAHPFSRLSNLQRANFSLVDYFDFLYHQPECDKLPIFTSMANVYSELYWQL